MTTINTTGTSHFSLSNERQKQMLSHDILSGLMPRSHDEDKPDYILSLEREVERLRNGILNPALRGRLAYEIRIKSHDHLDMPTARRIVDTALVEALKGGTS